MTNQAKLYKKINKGQIENGKALLTYAAPKQGEIVLDVGCGTGELTFDLARMVGNKGHVTAIDPDIERIKIARDTKPKDISNITFINDYFTAEIIEPKPTFDLFFSNYVFHWFENKEAEVQLTFDCLKSKGRFAIQLVYALPECLQLIREMTNQPLNLAPNLRERWLDYFDNVGLKYEIKSDVMSYYHSNIDDLLAWYEGTTHGVVSRANLSKTQLKTLRQKYPGKLHLDHPTLRLVGFKP